MALLRKNTRAAADRARKAGDWITAAQLYEEIGQLDLAIDCYEKAGRLIVCAQLALQLDRPDREEMAVGFFLRGGEPERAGAILRQLGRDRQAAEAFLQAGYNLDAATCFADAGELGRAVDLYVQEGKTQQAAELCENLKEWARAGELYAKVALFLKAAQCFENQGNHKRAAEIYQTSGRIKEAALAFGKAGDLLQAARLFDERVKEIKRSGTYVPPGQQQELDVAARGAAHFYQTAGAPDKALEILVLAEHYESAAALAEKIEQYARAGELYHEARNDKKASEMYALAGDHVRAAKLEAEYHLDHGNDEAAADALHRGGEALPAAELFEQLGRFDRAAACYQTLEAWPRAADNAARAGLDDQAAVFFERAGDPGRAAELQMKLGAFEKAAANFAKVERFFEAAQAAAEANAEREMLNYLQQVPKDDAHHVEAVVTLAHAFIRRGWSSIAVDKLEAVLRGQSVTGDNLELWDPFATALEEIGELERAEELLRNMISVSYNYRDVDKRHAKLVEKIEGEKTRGSSFDPTLIDNRDSDATTFDGNRYKLDELLGRGGMGEVYRAFDRLLSRSLAYKVLSNRLAQDPVARDLLLQEARSAAGLNHPNIITVYDLGIENGRAFICMELVEGESYAKILKRNKRLSLAEIMHLVVSVCQGLDHAHHRGIVHRDLKPSNILLTKEHRVKILDFGLAQPIQPDDGDASGSSSGTPKYIAPEQARGEATDARTDLYSFGATLFELTAGRAPFIEGNLLQHHIHTPPPRLKSVAPDVPDELDELVMHCLQKDPAKRFQSAGEMLSFAQAAGLV